MESDPLIPGGDISYIRIPADVARQIAILKDADAAMLLVYLEGLPQKSPDPCKDLGISFARLQKSINALRYCGYQPRNIVSRPSQEKPETNHDESFDRLIVEIQHIKGEAISVQERAVYSELITNYGFSHEGVLALLSYCVERRKIEKRTKKWPALYDVQKEAVRWAAQRYLDLDMITPHVEHELACCRTMQLVREGLGLDRQFSTDEEAACRSWFQLGFKHEAIVLAYRRAYNRMGKAPLNYITKIIQNWASKQLYSVADIEKYDPLNTSQNVSPATKETPRSSRAETAAAKKLAMYGGGPPDSKTVKEAFLRLQTEEAQLEQNSDVQPKPSSNIGPKAVAQIGETAPSASDARSCFAQLMAEEEAYEQELLAHEKPPA